jgi:ADP-ribose pyrophosphatase YjhB (NUDIX family)
MPALNLRPSARALILDDDDRILLCRFEFLRDSRTVVVWAAPGGGVEPGESLLEALRRELDEEVGLAVDGQPPHVWHQVVVRAGHAEGYDGLINDYFLVRTAAFAPRGSMTDEQLAAENLFGLRWWTAAELAEYRGPDLFSPRALPALLAALRAEGPPAEPAELGL